MAAITNQIQRTEFIYPPIIQTDLAGKWTKSY